MRRYLTSVLATAFLGVWSLLLLNLMGREQTRPFAPSIDLSLHASPLFQQVEPDPLQERQEKLQAALERPVRLEFVDARLSDIAAYLAEQQGIDIAVHRRGFAAHNLNPERSLSVQLPEVRLRSALTLMLQRYDLCWSAHDGYVQISPSLAAGEVSCARVFSALRLMQSPYDADDLDRHTLPTAIEELIAPLRWANQGGNGSLHVYRNALVVHQEETVMQEVQRFLAALEQAADDYRREPHTAVGRVYRWDDSASAERHRQIEAALGRSLSPIQFSETPLSAVLQWLARQTGAPLYLDDPVSAGYGGGTVGSQTVSLTIREEPLRDVLARLLTPLGLAYRVQHDVLYVTQQDSAADVLGRIYPVRDLIDPQGTEDEIFWRFRGLESPLLELVETTLETDFEGDFYGEVELAYLDSIDALVVSGPRSVHQTVQSLFAQLRSQRGPFDFHRHEQQLQAARQAPLTLPYQWLTFGGEPALLGVLRDTLQSRLPGKLRGKVQITMGEAQLRIRATAAEHRELEALIEQLGLPLWGPELDQNQSFGIVPVVG